MNKEHEIVSQVNAAKENSEAADALMRQYLPFIKAETAKFIPREGGTTSCLLLCLPSTRPCWPIAGAGGLFALYRHSHPRPADCD